MTATYSTIPDAVSLEAPQESKPKASRKRLLAAVLLVAAGAAVAATAVKSGVSTMTKFDDIEGEKDDWKGQIDVQVTNACGSEPPKELTARMTRFVGGPYPVCAGKQDPRIAVAIYDEKRGNPDGLVSIHSKSPPWNIISNWSSANKQCFEVELAGPKDQERVFEVASKNVIAYRGEKTVVDFVDITDC